MSIKSFLKKAIREYATFGRAEMIEELKQRVKKLEEKEGE